MKYSEELMELLLMDIPLQEEREHGFLDILGINYAETSITRIYAYFLDSRNSIIISNLFVSTLFEIILEKSGVVFGSQKLICETEVRTKEGRSIDLVLFSDDNQEAVIIENKINASLYNDLRDYYESVQANKKIGVVLSLTRMAAVPKEYVVITHMEWMRRIASKGLPVQLSSRQFIYLNDFISNMENISGRSEPNESVRFFFENTNKVLKAKATYDAAFNFVIEQLKITANKYSEDWELYGYSYSYRQIWNTKSKELAYYSINLEHALSSEPEITVIIEVYKDALLKIDELRDKLRNSGAYMKIEDQEMTRADFARLGQLTYKFTNEDILNLSSFLLKKLNEDFRPSMDLVLSNIRKN